jgi:cyanophycinase
MNGLITLVGAGEYLPVMEDVDRYLLESLNVGTPQVVCLPTAAGEEGRESINRWSRMGVEHFKKLGAEVVALPIIDKTSANDEQYAPTLESADLIYFSGGNPNHLYQTLRGSRAWTAMQKAWNSGAVYAGCSAGAMILAHRIPSFRLFSTVEGFGLVPAQYILPHFDAVPVMFKPLVATLKAQLKKGDSMLGIDENTAAIRQPGGEWNVMGQGQVHVFTRAGNKTYKHGQMFQL